VQMDSPGMQLLGLVIFLIEEKPKRKHPGSDYGDQQGHSTNGLAWCAVIRISHFSY